MNIKCFYNAGDDSDFSLIKHAPYFAFHSECLVGVDYNKLIIKNSYIKRYCVDEEMKRSIFFIGPLTSDHIVYFNQKYGLNISIDHTSFSFINNSNLINQDPEIVAEVKKYFYNKTIKNIIE